jgi:hypothetical protein
MTEQELEKRQKALTMAMERILPEFVKSCRESVDPLLIRLAFYLQPYTCSSADSFPSSGLFSRRAAASNMRACWQFF